MRTAVLVLASLGLAMAAYFDPDYLTFMKEGNFVGDKKCSGDKTFWAFFATGSGPANAVELQYVRGLGGAGRTIVDKVIVNRSICSEYSFNYFFSKKLADIHPDNKFWIFSNGKLVLKGSVADAFATKNYGGLSIPRNGDNVVEFPTASPAHSPTSSPSFAPTATCVFPNQWFSVRVQVDETFVAEAERVKWNLFRYNGDDTKTLVLHSGKVGDHLEADVCVAPGDYAFTLLDCDGNQFYSPLAPGSTNNGTYTLYLDGVVMKTKTGFSRADAFRFSVTNTPLCESNEQLLSVQLVLDNKQPQETSWELIKLGQNFNNLIVQSNATRGVCLTSGKYLWNIYDDGKDGICCSNGEGHYTVRLNGIVIKQGGEFETIDYVSFVIP
jgi:hypothetical protein